MSDFPTPFAISGIKDGNKIRVLLYANNQIAHAPLPALLKAGIESGTSANGNYLRLGDGTQICWRNGLDATQLDETDLAARWVFPARFISVPVVSFVETSRPVEDSFACSYWTGNADAHAADQHNATLSGYARMPAAKMRRQSGQLLQAMAIGRWY